MPQFILKIDLGNDAIQTPDQIAHLIRGACTRMDWMEHINVLLTPQKLFDRNGNVIGHYEVVD